MEQKPTNWFFQSFPPLLTLSPPTPTPGQSHRLLHKVGDKFSRCSYPHWMAGHLGRSSPSPRRPPCSYADGAAGEQKGREEEVLRRGSFSRDPGHEDKQLGSPHIPSPA